MNINTSTNLDRLQHIINQHNEAQAELHRLTREVGGELMSEYLVKTLFPADLPAEDDPIEAFFFRAYTPYFNDGDPCEYSVHDLEYVTKDTLALDEAEDLEDWLTDNCWEGDWISRDSEPRLLAARHSFESIPEDFIRAAFGDHVQVVITREGTRVEEYDHY